MRVIPAYFLIVGVVWDRGASQILVASSPVPDNPYYQKVCGDHSNALQIWLREMFPERHVQNGIGAGEPLGEGAGPGARREGAGPGARRENLQAREDGGLETEAGTGSWGVGQGTRP